MNLSSWYYKNILDGECDVIEKIIVNEVTLISGERKWEALAQLNKNNVPSWAPKSKIYSDFEGSGTSEFKNVAIHKAISEAIERWAFYSSIDIYPSRFGFQKDQSTTGMAAFPSITYKPANLNAKLEAHERWSLCAFWRGNLPVIKHETSIDNLEHFEIKTNFKNVFTSLLVFKKDRRAFFGFAAGKSLEESFGHAMIELNRNIRVFEGRVFSVNELLQICDKRLYFFSTEEGQDLFKVKLENAPSRVLEEPILICDEKIVGPWTKYAKVWRYLYADSYPDDDTDHTFFMF